MIAALEVKYDEGAYIYMVKIRESIVRLKSKVDVHIKAVRQFCCAFIVVCISFVASIDVQYTVPDGSTRDFELAKISMINRGHYVGKKVG